MTPPRSGAPPLVLPHFTRSILVRSLLTWGFVRAAATAGTAAVEAALRLPPSNPLAISPYAVLLVVAVVCAAGWVTARRRNEDLFLLSLGYGRARQMGRIAAPAVAIEAAIALAVAAS